MEPASIVLISLTAATLAFNIWQSHRSDHFRSQCMTAYGEPQPPIVINDGKK